MTTVHNFTEKVSQILPWNAVVCFEVIVENVHADDLRPILYNFSTLALPKKPKKARVYDPDKPFQPITTSVRP
jgi:hypothetical protein